MSEKSLTFIVEGNNASEVAKQIQQVITQEFGFKPKIEKIKHDSKSDSASKLELIAVYDIAKDLANFVIVAIPTGYLAYLNIKEKREKSKKLETILETVKKITKSSNTVVKIEEPDGRQTLVETLTISTVEIMEHIDK